MSYFAREIRYGGDDEAGALVALIELTRNKKETINYLVYRGCVDLCGKGTIIDYQMFDCKTKDKITAQEFFPYGRGYGDAEKDWINTTSWLCEAAFENGSWVKIRRPYFRKRKKKKLVLRFGLLEHILLAEKNKLKKLEDELSFLRSEEYDLRARDEQGDDMGIEKIAPENLLRLNKIWKEMEILDEKIKQQEVRIRRIKDEIRFKHKRNEMAA